MHIEYTQRLENLEKLESILQSGKSRRIFIRLEKSEKRRNFTQNTGKVWEMIKLIN